MDLHELPRKSCEGWNGQMVRERQPEGKDALFPVSPELTDDVLNVVFIDQDIPVHDRFGGNTFFHAFQDFLLVSEWDLGVGDQDRGDKGMGSPAFFAPDTLDSEAQQVRHKFHIAAVMPIADQAAGFAAGTFHHVKLELVKYQIIRIL